MPAVNPKVLAWARKTAGLSLDEAARKIDLADAYGWSGGERLAQLEQGEVQPSRALIERMASAYRRPLVAFYVSAPPPQGNRGQDFRRVTEVDEAEAPIVDALLREIHARQSLVRAALEEADQATHREFVDSMMLEQGAPALVERMRELLRLEAEDLWSEPDPPSVLHLLRERIEHLGVFVLLLGDLGSYHTAISVASFRGFALADPIAPFVVVNSNDSKTAQCFTLLHEFAHILLGETGISDYRAAGRVERVCNDAASEFLVPQEEVQQLTIDPTAPIGDQAAIIDAFATRRNVSRSMIAYKLYRAGRLSRDGWLVLRDHFYQLWLKQRETRRAKARVSERRGGPSFYVTRRYSAGPNLVDTAARLLGEGALSTAKASQVLRVKPTQLGKLLELPGATA